MPAKILRGGVHDEIRAEIERLLQGRRPGVVTNAKGARVSKNFRNCREIDDF